jgi:hypothetical protein
MSNTLFYLTAGLCANDTGSGEPESSTLYLTAGLNGPEETPSPLASNESSKLMYGGNGKLFIRLSSELNPVGTLLRY